jgi:hypothetical protein
VPRPAHTLATYSGLIRNSTTLTQVETWSIGIRGGVVSSADVATLEATANGLAGIFATHMAPRFGPDVTLTKVRVARVGADGLVLRTADGAYLQGDKALASPGSGTAAYIAPASTALTVSLTTARSGPTGKGRIFLPWPSTIALTAGKTIATADATQVAASVKAWLNAHATFWTPQVVSTKGYMSPITGLRVGLVPDTQRSRRHSIPENYVTATL